ncbi:hypothetical protein DYB32_001625 [Aphanomyces invadans]|uniref:Brix domain-containing protein n=1 Tax=Aphanomyces invadans TaxID=157072 RepID=A0A3R6VRS1_9STRA|nr:hypothetical protein DYB32_001625 [Aphanomyces invadans]
MLPFTADRLREKKSVHVIPMTSPCPGRYHAGPPSSRKNTIQDFVHVAAPLGVSHFLAFSNTDAGTNMKLVRLPRERWVFSVKTLVKSRVPNLGNMEDIADFVFGGTNTGMTSDSEVDDETAHVVLPDKFRGRGNQKAEKRWACVLGPRLTLKLTKVERDLCDGDVLYHAYAAKLKAKKDMANALKRKRREEQEQNVSKKEQAKEEKKQNKAIKKNAVENKRRQLMQYANEEDVSDLEDAEYYRQEVGEEPDAYMFSDRKPKEPKKPFDKKKNSGAGSRRSDNGTSKAGAKFAGKKESGKAAFNKFKGHAGSTKKGGPKKSGGRRKFDRQ